MTPHKNPSNSPVQTVIFDLGGVIVDWDPNYFYRKHFETDAEIAAHLEEIDFHGWNAKLDAGWDWKEGLESLTSQFPQHAELIRGYSQNYMDTISGTIPGTVRLFERLEEKGVPLYALTNYARRNLDLTREAHPILNRFRGMVVSGDEGVNKPDPRIYRILIERFSLDPAACLYVDDRPENVAAAEAFGFHGHVFTTAHRLKQDLQEYGLI